MTSELVHCLQTPGTCQRTDQGHSCGLKPDHDETFHVCPCYWRWPVQSHPQVAGFELNQLGLAVEIVPTLVDAIGLGVWISEQAADVQAEILIGLLCEADPTPAQVMLRGTVIARELRGRRIDLAWVTPAVEHLLHALRDQTDTTDQGDADAQPE